MSTHPAKYSEVIDLKFPFNIKNIVPKKVQLFDECGAIFKTVYDVSTFSTIKFQMKQINAKIRKEHPDYSSRIYAYRAERKTKDDEITRLKVKYNFTTYQDIPFCHIEIELVGPAAEATTEDE